MDTVAESPEVTRKRPRDDDGGDSERCEYLSDLSFAKRSCKDWGSDGGFSELFSREDPCFTGENFDPAQEELISDVMKSLEEEIRCSESGGNRMLQESAFPVTQSAVDVNANNDEGPSVSDSASSISGSANNTTNVDIQYLLGATDDELGIPPSPQSELVSFPEKENGGLFFENPVGDLFENFRPETEADELLQFCKSDCWYPAEEQDIGLFNDAVCQDWLARTLNGDIVNDSSLVDQTLMPLLEAGVGM